MTNQWFRSWHGAPTDPKWLGIARKADVAPGIVAALCWALLDRASQATERGTIAGYDADGLACFMGCTAEQVEHVVALMHEKGILENNAFSGWEKHQPKREDNSTERVKAHRERTETQCNATKHAETLDTDTDTENNKPSPAQARVEREPGFDLFWLHCPRKVGKGSAKQAYRNAIKKTSPETLAAAMRIFAAKQVGNDPKFIPHPASWLNSERWLDEDLQAKSQSETASQTVFVRENSPSWAAWAKLKKVPAIDRRTDHGIERGWYFPSEWPPDANVPRETVTPQQEKAA